MHDDCDTMPILMSRTIAHWTCLALLAGCGARGGNALIGADDASGPAVDARTTDVINAPMDSSALGDVAASDAGTPGDAPVLDASADVPFVPTDAAVVGDAVDVPNVAEAGSPCMSSRTCPGQVCDTVRHLCVDCIVDADCSSGTVCGPDDHCRAPACVTGPSTCTADGRVHTCDVHSGFVDTACPSGSTCVAGHCTGLACTPLAGFCGPGAERRICSADGTSFTTTLCPPASHATGSCVTDGCGLRCDAGFADCNGVATDGCEVDLRGDPANCGACRLACGAGCACASSSCGCGCPSGQTLCGGRCVSTASDPANCGGCGIACAAGPNSVASCSGGCTLTCAGANYDVDGIASDGCEVSDDFVAGHTMASPALAASQGCSDTVIGTLSGGRIVSDGRAHNPAPPGYDATTGSASDWWGVLGTGGSLCADNYAATITTSGGSSAACYRLTLITDRGSASTAVSGSGSATVSNLGFGLYTDNTMIYFHVEKTCPASVAENVSYTISFHL